MSEMAKHPKSELRTGYGMAEVQAIEETAWAQKHGFVQDGGRQMNNEKLKLKLSELDLTASKMREHVVKFDEYQIQLKGQLYELMKEIEEGK